MGHAIFQDILIIFILAIPVVLLVHLFRFPSIIGFIATGAIIGPEGIGLIEDKLHIHILAELGVALLLFSIGLEFSFDTFKKLRTQSLLGGILQIGLTIIAGVVIADFLGWSEYRGVYFGCLLALSSTALVISSFYYNKMFESLSGQLATAILILQDLALIPMIVILPLFSQAQTAQAGWFPLLTEAGKSLLIIVFITVIGRLVARKILHQILSSRSRELFIMTVFVVALGMTWLTHSLGFSMALGAFLGGLMVGGTEFKYQALSEISPFRYCFNSIFFVSIGMLLKFNFLTEHFMLVALFAILIPLLKMFVTTSVVSLVGVPLRLAMVVGISLAQIGEFSFLLAYVGQKIGAITPFFYDLIVTVAVISMIITPFMVLYAPRIADWIVRLPGFRQLARSEQEKRLEEGSQVIQKHVIVCGFGPLGETFGKILKEHKIPYIVLELNPGTISRLRQKKGKEWVFFGDGASEDILYRCGIERAKLLAITVPDYLNTAAIIQQARKLNPNIRIITRAKYRSEVEKLYDAGADIVISEELEGGIEMGRYALNEVGLPSEEIDAYIDKVREFGSADFF